MIHKEVREVLVAQEQNNNIMIVSMTGYGKATTCLANKKITVELKSLNSKTLDLNLRLPQIVRDKEMMIRNLISQKIIRGKVDLSIQIENESGNGVNQINATVVENYMQQIKTLHQEIDQTELLKIVLRMPDSFSSEKEAMADEEWLQIYQTIKEATSQLVQFRIDEGATLASEFEHRISNINQLLTQVEQYDNDRIDNIKLRIKNALQQLDIDIDNNRFEQELIYYLEKLDITEEKVRLKNHLDYFLETMKDNDGNGKKLGFILQEIGREINTLGSKANHAEVQKIVVMMKDELEKLKEQSLNVL